MSHVATIKLEVKDLEALGVAAREIGCELVRGQKTYKWYGYSVGDYPIPEGFTEADLGKCEHAIRVKGADARTYEVGVVKNPNGVGYVLLWDFWSRGYGLQDKIGDNANKLRQEYATEVACKNLRAKGQRVTKKRLQNGTIQLVATR